jgi:GNAT superfamily N-acetyltransferase
MIKKELSVRECITKHEKETAQRFRQTHFFDSRSIKDPYTWTFHTEGHSHFALYEDGEIIGYAHVQYWPAHRAALRIIVVNKGMRNRGYGSYLLKICEQKLKEKGIRTLQTEAAPDVIEFYKSLGYEEMPFNDPEQYPSDERDTPLGKAL